MMIKLALTIAQTLRRIYWRVLRPQTLGTRAVLVDESGRILLVKHHYLKGWYLPGGKIGKRESIIDGLRRELREEVGIELLASSPKILGVYSSFAEYKSDHIVVFVVTEWKQQVKSHFEIADQEFFAPDDLPQDTSPATKRRITEFLQGSVPDYKW
jgi:8-oxo-dGTP pyrophosphatase MutT (NUDIX family)